MHKKIASAANNNGNGNVRVLFTQSSDIISEP